MYDQKVERKRIDESVVDDKNTAVLSYKNQASFSIKTSQIKCTITKSNRHSLLVCFAFISLHFILR